VWTWKLGASGDDIITPQAVYVRQNQAIRRALVMYTAKVLNLGAVLYVLADFNSFSSVSLFGRASLFLLGFQVDRTRVNAGRIFLSRMTL